MKNIFSKLKTFVANGLRTICPKWWDVFLYVYREKHFCNLRNPSNFYEKLMWIQWHIYQNNKSVIQCLDKNMVRRYVEEKGCGEILIPLLKVFKTPDEIKLEDLPNSFVLKRSWGCGDVFICPDKGLLDPQSLEKAKKHWRTMSGAYDRNTCRMLGIKRDDLAITYVCENYLVSLSAVPNDYKFYCFNGVPRCVLVVSGRYTNNKCACLFDTNWKELVVHNYQGFVKNAELKKPENFDQMCEYAKALSGDFPFARVDLYNINGKIYFGEITLFPSTHPIQCDTIQGRPMGDWLVLPSLEGK